MNRDLTVYTYHPRQRLLWAPAVIIAAMAILGFVRGLMGAADLSLEPGFSNRGQGQSVGAAPRPVVLETIPTLTPRLIGAAPPAPKAPAPVETAAVNAPAIATNAATNGPAAVGPVVLKSEPAPTEAAPSAPPPTVAPPAPPAALQGLY